MAWIQCIFSFIVIIGKLQIIAEGKGVSSHKQSHFHTSQVSHHIAFRSRARGKQKTAFIFNPTPQKPHFEAPVKKSITAVIRKSSRSQNNHVKHKLSMKEKITSIRERPALKHKKRTKSKSNANGAKKGLELSDDLLAGSVKQLAAIENALSFERASFHEMPRPLSSIADDKTKTPRGRATKSTIEILSEKTNPEGGLREVARFRSEPEDKMIETSIDESTAGDTSLKSAESLFRRTMPKMFKEKEESGVKEKRSFHDENSFEQYDSMNNQFPDAERASSKSYGMEDGGWESPEEKGQLRSRRPADDTVMLKHILNEDTMAFGTLQEANDEQNTINEVEKLSKQGSVLPKNLHFPYMSGPMDDMGLDFSKMDISVGKLNSMENSDLNESEDSKGLSFLKRHSVPATGTGHTWETRNRDKIPRHHIERPDDLDSLSDMESEQFEQFPRYARFPAFYRSPEIHSPELDEFHSFERFPPIAPAILTREDKAPREPIPPREAEPEDEPPPVSEFIEADEPAPIPEIPSLREIPPIPEIREPEPKALKPKDTFGS